MSFLEKTWSGVVKPLLRRPPRVQVAALCYREGAEGRQVLVITSRGTGRWILPKGWPMEGLDGPGTALREAWEEAGVRRASASRQPVGSFASVKHQDNGVEDACEVEVFALKVQCMSDVFPENGERERRWVSLEDAAEMVDEPGLREILATF